MRHCVCCKYYKMGPLRLEKDCWRKSDAACHVIVCQSETAESDSGAFDTEQL